MTKENPSLRLLGEGRPGILFIPLPLCYFGLEPANISRVSVDKFDHLFSRAYSIVFPRCHHCSIFTTHWAMTLFSNVRYTSSLTVELVLHFLKLAVHQTPFTTACVFKGVLLSQLYFLTLLLCFVACHLRLRGTKFSS